MAIENQQTGGGVVLKQAHAGPKKAKPQRSIVIEPKTLVIAGFFAVAVVFAVIVGVRTFKSPAYPALPEARAAEASRVANAAEASIAARVAAGAGAKANPAGRK